MRRSKSNQKSLAKNGFRVPSNFLVLVSIVNSLIWNLLNNYSRILNIKQAQQIEDWNNCNRFSKLRKAILKKKVLEWGLYPRYFYDISLLETPHCFKELAFLFPAELEVVQYVLHRSLWRATPLMATLQIVYDTPLDFSAFPSGVPNQGGER